MFKIFELAGIPKGIEGACRRQAKPLSIDLIRDWAERALPTPTQRQRRRV